MDCGDRFEMLVEAFLRGLVVVGSDGEDAVNAEDGEFAGQGNYFGGVVAAGAAENGDFAAASSTVIATTRRCSAWVSVGLSPVVPQGTRKSTPA